jgi:ATPase subunit of ABC transporter with duplicated ATPase domains
MGILLQATDVSHSAGEKVLFTELDLSLSEGERLALFGHNGFGKSTLLNILGGGLIPDRGSISNRRGLHGGTVEQFLPLEMEALDVLSAVQARCEADYEWQAASILDELGFDDRNLATAVGERQGTQRQVSQAEIAGGLAAGARRAVCTTR